MPPPSSAAISESSPGHSTHCAAWPTGGALVAVPDAPPLLLVARLPPERLPLERLPLRPALLVALALLDLAAPLPPLPPPPPPLPPPLALGTGVTPGATPPPPP